MIIRNRSQAGFLITLVVTFIVFNVLIGVFLINWSHLLSILQFLVLECVNLGIAYDSVTIGFALLTSERANSVAHLESLVTQPRVALLYATCNDRVEEAVSRLGVQAYPNVQVFILDDSTHPDFQCRNDDTDFQIVRRHTLTGHKAGSLNYWLEHYGSGYDYFVILDSDSILGKNFVSDMLMYAEHPGNINVAIFQSIVAIWNRDRPFSKAIHNWQPIWQYPFAKSANCLDMALSVGHNCLVRVQPLLDIGGFCEKYVAEDYATSIGLMQCGYELRVVPVHSFEAAPTSVRSYTGRNIRWAKQTLELFGLDMSGIPVTTQLHVFMNFYSFAVWLVYLPGMILSLFGVHSTLGDITEMLRQIQTGQFLNVSALPAYVTLLAFYMTFTLSKIPIAIAAGVRLKLYFYSLIVFISMTAYVIIPQMAAQLVAIIRKAPIAFSITYKGDTAVSLKGILTDNGWSALFIVLLVIIGVAYNPMALIWNFPWIIPILVSPFVLYQAHFNVSNDTAQLSTLE